MVIILILDRLSRVFFKKTKKSFKRMLKLFLTSYLRSQARPGGQGFPRFSQS